LLLKLLKRVAMMKQHAHAHCCMMDLCLHGQQVYVYPARHKISLCDVC